MLHSICYAITKFLVDLLAGWGMPRDWASLLINILAWIVGVVVAITIMMVAALVLVYLERKVSGWIQSRVGPLRVGPQGLFQTPMDAVKLLQKEDIVPAGADKILHTLGPVLFFTASLLAWIVLPWDRDVVIGRVLDSNVGLLFFLGASGMAILGVLIGGWGSNNKWSLLGAFRAAGQIISYEIPMLLALLCVVLTAESLSLHGIVENQDGAGLLSWNICRPYLWLPTLIFIICMFAEVSRQPFDLPEAESELVAGYHTEYTGMKFALYFLGEYANVLLISLMVAVLFLGGWLSPFGETVIPGVLWLFAKAGLLVFFILWVRWTLPRMRIDQLMSLAWKLLTPAGFVALAIVAVSVVQLA
jgi:NADH-quinone oxidoreductase subunit H